MSEKRGEMHKKRKKSGLVISQALRWHCHALACAFALVPMGPTLSSQWEEPGRDGVSCSALSARRGVSAEPAPLLGFPLLGAAPYVPGGSVCAWQPPSSFTQKRHPRSTCSQGLSCGQASGQAGPRRTLGGAQEALCLSNRSQEGTGTSRHRP